MKAELNFNQLFQLLSEHLKKGFSKQFNELKSKQEFERQKLVRRHYKQRLLLTQKQNEDMSNLKAKHQRQTTSLKERMKR